MPIITQERLIFKIAVLQQAFPYTPFSEASFNAYTYVFFRFLQYFFCNLCNKKNTTQKSGCKNTFYNELMIFFIDYQKQNKLKTHGQIWPQNILLSKFCRLTVQCISERLFATLNLQNNAADLKASRSYGVMPLVGISLPSVFKDGVAFWEKDNRFPICLKGRLLEVNLQN